MFETVKGQGKSNSFDGEITILDEVGGRGRSGKGGGEVRDRGSKIQLDTCEYSGT